MAFCMNCGQRLPEGAKFCSNCGAATGEVKSETAQRKIVYDGEVHKCPNCGEIVDSFVLNCPSCGHEFRSSASTSLVQELASKLEAMEQQQEPRKRRTIKDELLRTNNLSKTDEQKISLIRSFVIPNTKEDILEFIILASSNINVELYGESNLTPENEVLKAVSDAWIAKFEQAYRKAQFSFSETPTFTQIKEVYINKTNEINKQKKKKTLVPLLALGGLLALSLLCFLISKLL
jgi:RNA polymerase subunit RPABC4/transcription elongation factor Spt4